MAARVTLEPLTAAHALHLQALAEDPDVQQNTLVPIPPSPGFGRTWAERYEEGRADGSREGFAVVGAAGSFLGIAVAFGMDGESRQAELGYVVAREARGRSVATEALRLLTAWGFEQGLEPLELRINVGNEASMRVAERCGYTREGTLRSVHFKGAARTDAVVYSRLRTD